MERKRRIIVEITVLDYLKKVVSNARVIVTQPGGKSKKGIELKFDKQGQKYISSEFKIGLYLLTVEAEGFEPQAREVQVGISGLKDIFILGKKGMPFYYKGQVMVPFEQKNDLLAVAVITTLSGEQEKELNKTASELGLRPEEISDEIRANHARIFRFLKEPDVRTRQSVQDQLGKSPFIRLLGPITHLDTRGLSFLTNEIIVRFKNTITRDQMQEVVRSLNLEVIREIPHIPNGYLLRMPGKPTYDLLNICNELVKRGVVVYAEPNLFVTAILNYTPNDPRLSQQPHHALIHSEAAWNTTMGDPGILIALMDDGCDTNHEDFTNSAGAGWTKVVNQFNFTSYTTALDDSSHGTRSCGIATAIADNLLGVAGVAPGCQLMPVEWLTSTMADWSDAYIWISGGNPGRVAPFPATLTKGADVISNSIGVWDFPISGIMKDTWDYIMTYGRNGRGCIVVFAAGNDNIDMAKDSYSQWANYEKTIAVASCTISPPDAIERKVSTSCFGDAIDLCAPAGGPAGGTETRTMSTANTNTYATHGQTSCACPQVAGAAALILSANPDLSWVEVRQLLRDAAQHIDAANTDPDGIWEDVNGTPSNAPGYLGPYHSRWYGFGMLDVDAAVQAAVNLVGIPALSSIDTWIMENSMDIGDVPCWPPYSPDVWVRNLSPATDDPAHITEHQSPIRGQNNWVYANVRNRGAIDSHDVYVRLMITRWAGTQYAYPQDFIPTVNPSTLPVVMAPGTYLIGEYHIPTIPAHGMVTVNTEWVKDLIPPGTVTINGVVYSWADSCLLVDISPHDGPAPVGIHTWEDNNICQRNISIVDPLPTDNDTFAIAFVVGHRLNTANHFNLKIERKDIPVEIKLYVDYIDKEKTNEVLNFLDKHIERGSILETCELTIHTEAKAHLTYDKTGDTLPITILPGTEFDILCCHSALKPIEYKLIPKRTKEGTIFALPTVRNAYVPILRKQKEYQIVAIIGKGLKKLKKGDYKIDVFQEDLNGRLDGGVNFIIRKK
jgi:subtilisin family serine protease